MHERVGAEPEHRSRRMWRALDPEHTVTYFAPESQAACEVLGTKGFWMSYVALRVAPLGAAPPVLVSLPQPASEAVPAVEDCTFRTLESREIHAPMTFRPRVLGARHAARAARRPKNDRLDAVWLAKVAERQMIRPASCPPDPAAARSDPLPPGGDRAVRVAARATSVLTTPLFPLSAGHQRAVWGAPGP
jgi:hypothetical protein